MAKKGEIKSGARGKSGVAKAGQAPPPRTRNAFVKWLSRPSSSMVLLFVVSFALYANTLGHDFVWDDHSLIVENPLIRTLSLSAARDMFSEDFWEIGGPGGSYYRPLVTLSYALDYKIFAGRPGGFHLTNVLWNALTCAMAFLFVYLVFGNAVIALASALLFAVHPVHTEAVAWVSGRTDVLAAFWSLVALSIYVIARRRRNHLLLFGALVAFLLALFSKESAICVPFLIALMELRPIAAVIRPTTHRPNTQNTNRAVGSVARVALFFGVFAFYLILRNHAVGVVTSNFDTYAPGILGFLGVPLSVFAGYVYKVLLPFRLSAEYDAPVPSSFADPQVLIGAISVLILAGIVWRERQRAFLVLGVGLFVMGIAPVLNIIPIGEVSAERFLYFPSLGAALVFGAVFAAALQTRYVTLVTRQAQKFRAWNLPPLLVRFLVILFPIVIVAASGATVTRNAVWKDDITLFAKTSMQTPDSPRAYALFGKAALKRGDIDGATRAYRKALALDPNNPNTLNLLAGLYVRLGRYDDAIPLVKQALTMSPDDPQLNSNLGSIYLETGQYAEAEAQFRKTLALNPNQLRTHFNLGLTLLEQGKPEAGREHLVRSLQGGSEFNMANYYLTMIEIAAGDSAQARTYARLFLAAHSQNDTYRQTAEAFLRGEGFPSQP